MKLVRLPSLVFAALVVISSAFGHNGEDACHDVLVQTNLSRVDNTLKKLALLHLINSQQDFEASKNFGQKLSAIYDGIPISATTDYNQFKKYQNSLFVRDELQMSDEEAHSLVTTFLPEAAIEAWAACMQNLTHAGGLSVGVVDIQPNEITVRVHWDPPTPADFAVETVPITISQAAPPEGGQLKNEDKKVWSHLRNLTGHRDEIVHYSREPGKRFHVVIKATARSGETKSQPVTVPPDVEYFDGTERIDMKEAFVSIPHGTTFAIVPIHHFRPGSKVLISLTNSGFVVDRTNRDGKSFKGIWIDLGARAGNTVLKEATEILKIEAHPGDPDDKGTDEPKAFNFSTQATVPWDGILDIDFVVSRAQTMWGDTSALTATGGTLSIRAL